ncbi:hypothetical protein, partial [Bartonella sp. MR168JLCBS]|uniref:hypothetical protein n=1 Tax=Bartonella sp. MR168JLCBS TaxID=3243556 RepID=UPI0035D06468
MLLKNYPLHCKHNPMTVAVIKDAGKKTDEQACLLNLTNTIKERVRINLVAASPCFGACEYKSGRR